MEAIMALGFLVAIWALVIWGASVFNHNVK